MKELVKSNIVKFTQSSLTLFMVCLLAAAPVARGQQSTTPHLRDHGKATQLVVDGDPWLLLAGELGNSSAASGDYMEDIWPDLEEMELNTLLAPVYWELIEPEGLQNVHRLNGDQSHQGRHLRIPFGDHDIQRIKLYCYQ